MHNPKREAMSSLPTKTVTAIQLAAKAMCIDYLPDVSTIEGIVKLKSAKELCIDPQTRYLLGLAIASVSATDDHPELDDLMQQTLQDIPEAQMMLKALSTVH